MDNTNLDNLTQSFELTIIVNTHQLVIINCQHTPAYY